MKKTSIILMIALAGLALRAWDIDLRGLNTDEVYTAKIALFDEHIDFRRDVHPPAYIEAVSAVGSIIPGSIEFKARAVSVFSGFAFILLMAYVGHLAGGFRGAVIAALLTAFDPGLIALSRLGRGYMFSALILGATFPLTWGLVRKPSDKKRIALLALASALALYTFYYAAYLIAAQAAVALIIFRRNRSGAISIGIATGLAGLAFIPWLPTLFSQMGRIAPGGGWTQWPLTPYEFARRAVQVFIHHSPFQSFSDLAYFFGVKSGALITALLAVLIIFGAWSSVRKRGADLRGFALADRAGGMGLGLPLMLIVSVYVLAAVGHGWRGIYIGFPYFAFLAPPIMAIVIMALDVKKNRFTPSAIAAAIIAAHLVLIPGVRDAHREDIREAVHTFDRNAGGNASAFTIAHFVKDAFTVYSSRPGPFYGLPVDLPGHSQIPRESPGVMTPKSEGAFKKLLAGREEIWLILSHEKRGGKDRGGTKSIRWLNESGFKITGHGAARAVRWIVFRKGSGG